MPIQTIPEKARTMLHFGTGDIHITDAKMHVDDGAHHLVVFHQMEPHPIGSSAPELHGTACDDFSVGMTFSKAESIDAVISVLAQFREKHFPDAPKGEPASVGVGRLREALAPFAEMAKYRTFPFHGDMQAMQANPSTASEPGFQLFYRDFYRAADLLAAMSPTATETKKEGV